MLCILARTQTDRLRQSALWMVAHPLCCFAAPAAAAAALALVEYQPAATLVQNNNKKTATETLAREWSSDGEREFVLVWSGLIQYVYVCMSVCLRCEIFIVSDLRVFLCECCLCILSALLSLLPMLLRNTE